MKTPATLIAALAVLAVPGLASAAPVEGRSVTVSVADLNLATGEGRARAERRINSAAKAVCANGDERQLAALAAYNRCHDKALGDAITALRTKTASVEVAAR